MPFDQSISCPPSRVACLSAAGTAPELMAEASLALTAVARLHGLSVDYRHVPCGAAAIARSGQPFPAETRSTVLEADAVLLAGADQPTLAEVAAELDLRARVTHVAFGRGHEVVIVSPFGGAEPEWTLETAFRIAERHRLPLSSVGDPDWRDRAEEVAAAHGHVQIEHLSPTVAIPLAAFDPVRLDVVAATQTWAESISEIAAVSGSSRVVAHGLLAEHGPGLFMPSADGALGLEGQGLVDPSSMLLAAALLLEYGLGFAAAAHTLAGSVSAALAESLRTRDLPRRRMGATSREFTARVLAGFQLSFRNAEFWQGIA